MFNNVVVVVPHVHPVFAVPDVVLVVVVGQAIVLSVFFNCVRLALFHKLQLSSSSFTLLT